MSEKVYVITDKSAIEFIENNDIEGFRKTLKMKILSILKKLYNLKLKRKLWLSVLDWDME